MWIVSLVIAIAGLAYGVYAARKAGGDLSGDLSRLSNVRLQTSAYGGVIPMVYGRNRISGNLLWYGAFTSIANTQTSGGKGGGGVKSTFYTYTVSMVMALGHGILANITQVFRDKKVFQGQAVTGGTLFSAAEYQPVPAGSPHTVAVLHAAEWVADNGVTYNGTPLAAGTDYSVAAGVYTFTNSFYWGKSVSIAYRYSSSALWQSALSQAGLSLFTGSGSQNPWSYLATNFPGQDLAYRNIAYVTAQDYDLGTTAVLGNHSFEVDGKLQYGSLPSLAQTFTATLATSRLDSSPNNFVNGTAVKLSSTGSLPYFLQAGIVYWAVNVSGTTYQVALSKNGEPLAFTAAGGAGSGVHTATPQITDCNPKDVLNDILTNALTGAGYPASAVGSLANLSDYCIASGLFVSPYYSGQRSAAEIVTQLLTIANSVPYFSEGVLKVVPLADTAVTGNSVTYTPNVTPAYNLTDDDFLPTGEDPVTCTRKSQADAYNHIQVKFNSRANAYNEEVVEAKDQANIDLYGLRTMPPVSMPEITEAAVARAVAQMLLQRVLYLRNLWSFRLPVKFLLLEPTDLVTLTDSGLGLSLYPVRLLSIEEQEDGSYACEAEDFPGNVSSTAAYPSQPSAGVLSDNNVDPGSVNTPVILEAPGILTVSGFELWCALSGGANWGGAQIWVSTDQDNYVMLGTVYGPARYGVTTATFPSGADPDTVNTCAVDLGVSDGTLSNGTAADADQFNSLCYVDGELIAFTVATLTGLHQYDLLSYIRRGVYNTPIGAHNSGTPFVRLDDAVGKVPYDPALIGKMVYLKFVSFNIHGFHPQDISLVTAYPYTITGGLGAPDDVENFNATQQGSLVMFTWDLLPAANISGYEIRYLPQDISGLTWDDAAELTKVTKGTQVTSARLPPGDWTCLIKAVDDSLRYSVTAASSDVGMANNYTVIEQQAQSPDWPGTKTNCGAHYLGNLFPLSQSLANAGSGYEIFDQYVYNPVASLEYEAAEIDLGMDGQARLYAIPIARLGPGVATGAPRPVSHLKYRLDADSYGVYQPWGIGSVACRYFRFKLTADVTQGLLVVNRYTPTADAPLLTQGANGVAVGSASGITVTYPARFFNPPSVQATPVGTSAITAVVSAVTDTGFFVQLFNNGGAGETGTINWTASGV